MSNSLLERVPPLVIASADTPLQLHEWQMRDAPSIYQAVQADPQGIKQSGDQVDDMFSSEAAIARYAQQHPGYMLPLRMVVDEQTVGTLHTELYPNGAEIGYWVASAHTRRGYATQALGLLAGFAFRSANLVQLEARIKTDNTASRRTAEKAGFQEVGLAEDDCLLYVLDRARWYGRQGIGRD